MVINHSTRLLVVSPHPDDEAVGVGGLIGKVKKEKGEIMILYMGVGDSRQFVTGTTQGSVRLQEVERVKKFVEAATKVMYVQKDHVRLDAVPQKDMVENIDDVIDGFKPNMVAIPTSSSYNQDHRATFDACMSALRPMPKSTRHCVDHVLEYFEPYFWSSRPQKEPNAYLDLSEKFGDGNLFNFKIELYKCHTSQVREDPSPRSIENLERLAHVYGKEIGVQMAEAYHVLRTVF